MIARRCCNAAFADASPKTLAAQTHDGIRPPTFLRRCFDIAEWIVPGAILALLPKCPLCLIAYFGLATGVGISMSTLMQLRTFLVLLCAASLFYLAIRSIQRVHRLNTGR
jgi:hypothetical protein